MRNDYNEQPVRRLEDAPPLATLFPAGMFAWAGDSNGGVRKPFSTASGRPTGNRIETPLIARLREWARDVACTKADAPKAIVLIGGPGNGKSDAIESCIEFLDEALGASGALFSSFRDKFADAGRAPAPRRVEVELDTFVPDAARLAFDRISLVQDATAPDLMQRGTACDLLAGELEIAAKGAANEIYLCCVNRGILAEAGTLALKESRFAGASALISAITSAVTSKPSAPPCWPLQDFANVAIWPMDVESLVERVRVPATTSPVRQILDAALDAAKWQTPCSSGPRCPYCRNRTLLAREGNLDSFVQLLRYFEIASGKRWTFRDLFSLVSYMLVGGHEELRIKNRQHSPCEWVAHQHELIETASTPDAERTVAQIELVSRLYHHRLFPCWPALDTAPYRRAKQVALGKSSFNPGIEAARGLFRYMAGSRLRSRPATDIARRVHGQFSTILDPALCSPDSVLFLRKSNAFTVDALEDAFSLGVAEGLDAIGTQIEPLERDLLRRLALADAALVDDNFPRSQVHHVKLLQSSIRQYSARSMKRSLGVRAGACRDLATLVDYERTLADSGNLHEVRKQLRSLMHDSEGRFRACLATTFGQPVSHVSREIFLRARSVSIAEVPVSTSNARPRDTLPYLKVDANIVPVTFQLFRSLREVANGLHDASLPPEIFALLDGIKALVAGHIVRNGEILNDDASLSIAAIGERLEIVGGRIVTPGGN